MYEQSILFSSVHFFVLVGVKKYNREVYVLLMEVFDYLPLAATVVNDQVERISDDI